MSCVPKTKEIFSKFWCVLPQTDVRTPKEDGARKRNFEDDDHLTFFFRTKSSFFCACGKHCFATAQLPLFLLQEMTAVILAVIACHQRMTTKTMTVILLEVKNLYHL